MKTFHIVDVTDYHDVAVFFDYANCVNFFKTFRKEQKWLVYVNYIDENGEEYDWDLLNWADIPYDESTENNTKNLPIYCNIIYKGGE